jgi:carbon-monoxide dehydrogenase medium subunit
MVSNTGSKSTPPGQDCAMSLGNFNLHHPATVAEACALGARFGRQAAYLAGGTELLVDLRSGRKSVAEVISLGSIPGLKGVRAIAGGIEIGATTPLAVIAESPLVIANFPALAEGIATMAGRQVRNLGTIGGNFSCGVPCSDTPPIVCVAGGRVALVAADGSEREVAAEKFVLAPRVTVLQPGEIVTAIRLPNQPAHSGASFQRFSLRRGSALAVASVVAWVRLEKKNIAEARIYMGAVGPVALAATQAAASLVGKPATAEAFAKAGDLAAAEAQPISDLRGSADYRRDIVAVLATRALTAAVQRAEGGDR